MAVRTATTATYRDVAEVCLYCDSHHSSREPHQPTWLYRIQKHSSEGLNEKQGKTGLGLGIGRNASYRGTVKEIISSWEPRLRLCRELSRCPHVARGS